MTILYGNLWDEIGKADLILFTGNGELTSCGGLVMGKGAALEARRHFPFLSVKLGVIVGNRAPRDYHIATVPQKNDFAVRVGVFQTKRYWREPSDLALIQKSCELLANRSHLFQRIALNFPGIGLGGLDEADVLPILEQLPDNVFIYKPKEVPTA